MMWWLWILIGICIGVMLTVSGAVLLAAYLRYRLDSMFERAWGIKRPKQQ